MRSDSEALIISLAGDIERGTKVPIDRVCRVFRKALTDHVMRACRDSSGEAFDANRLIEAIDKFTGR